MQELLKIVEVDKEDRVFCCAPGCNRPVYKRIHIVRDNDEILVLGQTCFGAIYNDITLKESSYHGESSRRLSPEEKKLLVENTKALISIFESEHELEESKRAVELELATAPCRVPKPTRTKVVFDGTERYVKCSYCGNRMPTNSKSMPAKGFKCEQCLVSGASLPPRITNRFHR